jgi:hypothetical protein
LIIAYILTGQLLCLTVKISKHITVKTIIALNKELVMNKVKCMLLSLTALCSSMQISQAAVITTGCSVSNNCTLQELVSGAEIHIGDVAFTNWQEMLNIFNEVNSNGDDVDGPLDLSGVYVSGVDAVSTGNIGEFILGLSFNSQVALSLPQLSVSVLEAELELDFDYNVAASNGVMITAVELELGSRNLNSADSFVEVNLNSTPIFSLQVFDQIEPNAPTSSVLMDSHVFASSLTSLQLTSNIQTGTFIPGGVALYGYDVMFTVQGNINPPDPDPVPAPASLSLLFLGSAMMFLQRRKLTAIQK